MEKHKGKGTPRLSIARFLVVLTRHFFLDFGRWKKSSALLPAASGCIPLPSPIMSDYVDLDPYDQWLRRYEAMAFGWVKKKRRTLIKGQSENILFQWFPDYETYGEADLHGPCTRSREETFDNYVTEQAQNLSLQPNSCEPLPEFVHGARNDCSVNSLVEDPPLLSSSKKDTMLQ
jgi:hypothetical protein